MPFANETDAAYDARLAKLGITDEEFDDAFNEEFPDSNSDVTTAVFHTEE